MSDDYCNICDKTINMKYKQKFYNTTLHRHLSTRVVKRFCVKNPPFLQLRHH